MNYDIRITAMQAYRFGRWVSADIISPADVELAADDRMLVAEQGDERMAWDTDGSPASDEYLAVAPLDPTGDDRLRKVYVVTAHSSDGEPAVFSAEDDANTYAGTFEDATVFDLFVCRGELAAEMIASRTDEEENPEDRAKERATCSHCLARTYRGEECVCPTEPDAPDGDAEDYDEALADEQAKA